MTQIPSDTAYIIVGKIGSTYGVKGWIKILSFTEVISNILEYSPWYLEKGTAWEKLEVQDSAEHGKGIIVKFAGYDSPEKARLLSGKNIAILRSQLPALPQNEYYWSDLKGLTVINQSGEVLGEIIYLMATGSNDVLVVKNKKEHAIPYIPGKIVTHIDLEKREMHVNWEEI